MLIRQNANQAGRDIVGRDKVETNFNVYGSTVGDELTNLYEKLKIDGVGEPSHGQFSQKLEHYLSAPTDGDVRGLEAKLKDSDREDLLHFGMQLKEQAAKMVMRYQTSKTAQRILTILLDGLHTDFMLTVTPVIQSGASRTDVDQSINYILHATSTSLGENILELTRKDLLALLYFLGGNCHIRWDKC